MRRPAGPSFWNAGSLRVRPMKPTRTSFTLAPSRSGTRTTVVRVPLRDGAKVKDVRVGFIGLTRNDPAFQKEGPAGRRIVTVDAYAAAEKQVPALRQKADIV